MTKPEATPAEREKLRKYRSQIQRELPQLRQRAKQVETAKREAAMNEPTVSGQLRRAVVQGGYDHRQLAQQLGVPGKAVAEFLAGVRPLDSSTIDKLAALLRQELKPIG